MGRHPGLIVVVAATIAAVLGWGWWHARTHASVHVSINDVALKTQKLRWAGLQAGDVVLRRSDGRALAHGRVREPLGLVEFTDEAGGQCERFEGQTPHQNAGRPGWATCFEDRSRWQAGWVGEVASASVTTGTCTIANVPVRTRRDADWWLWWVPLPHVGGTPYANYSFTIFVDSQQCAAANPGP